MSRRRVWGCLALPVAGALLVTGWWVAPLRQVDAWRFDPTPEDWSARRRQIERWQREGSARSPEHVFVPLGAVDRGLVLAVLVGEDISFFDHGVIDLAELTAAVRTWREGGRLRGASTISQQLAKTLFLGPERTLYRKLAEARLAWWMERRLGKRRILEIYLNVVEFGPGVFGVEAAARRYYKTGCVALTDLQAAGLAAAIPSPGKDNPATRSTRWSRRQATILRRMTGAAWLARRIAVL